LAFARVRRDAALTDVYLAEIILRIILSGMLLCRLVVDGVDSQA
jgi:hypothetical protein